jgi:hypothetical protein
MVFVDDECTTCVRKAVEAPAPTAKTETSLLKTGAPENPKPKDPQPVAGAPKAPDCLTGQLADSLFNIFKTFTGR